MKFYALVLWRLRGHGAARCCSWSTSAATARCCVTRPTRPICWPPSARCEALWKAIERALETGEWRARRSRLCDWCDHQALCPEFGGTPPPVPDRQPGDTVRSNRRAATDEL